MDSFELRRVELLHSLTTDEARQWFVLNFKICGVGVRKFFSSSPLVAHFPSEFCIVRLSDLKNGGSLDGRYVQNNEVAIASLFGVVSAILRQKLKEGEMAKHRWLIDKINSLKIGTETCTSLPSDDSREELKVARDASAAIEIENNRLKADLDQARSQLISLSEEFKKISHVRQTSELNKIQEKEEKVVEDVWTSISDVCDRFQVNLTDVIAGQVHSPEVERMLSDIAEKIRSNSSSPLQALEIMLGDSSPQFFQYLRVPDWTLLYFKLQSRIPDEA